LDPLYPGNLYVGYGAFGLGPTTPEYGWWDANLPWMMPALMAWAAMDYPRAQWFFGQPHRFYDQNLLTTLATQGIIAEVGGCAGRPAFMGMDLLGLSTIGGYQYGFPNVPYLGTLHGNFGLSGSYTGGPWTMGVPLGVPFSGTVKNSSLFAMGQTNAWNASYTTLSQYFGGGVAGPGGVGGAIGSSYGGFYPGFWYSEIGVNSGCLQPQ
jgi:hypothetical protein